MLWYIMDTKNKYMKLRELKDWVNNLPEEFDDFTVVNGEIGRLDDEYWFRLDKPITTLNVDLDNREIYIFNDVDEDEFWKNKVQGQKNSEQTTMEED